MLNSGEIKEHNFLKKFFLKRLRTVDTYYKKNKFISKEVLFEMATYTRHLSHKKTNKLIYSEIIFEKTTYTRPF